MQALLNYSYLLYWLCRCCRIASRGLAMKFLFCKTASNLCVSWLLIMLYLISCFSFLLSLFFTFSTFSYFIELRLASSADSDPSMPFFSFFFILGCFEVFKCSSSTFSAYFSLFRIFSLACFFLSLVVIIAWASVLTFLSLRLFFTIIKGDEVGVLL